MIAWPNYGPLGQDFVEWVLYRQRRWPITKSDWEYVHIVNTIKLQVFQILANRSLRLREYS